MVERKIHIDWEGPFLLEDMNELNNDEMDYGVYQVYGTHPVYGSNVLLYIGKCDEQTFCKRIKQHKYETFNNSDNIEIYIGRLSGESTPHDKKWSDEIDIAEQLLIYAHSPAGNSKNIGKINKNICKNATIYNWCDYRDLMPEVSGYRQLPDEGLENYIYYGDEI